MSYLIIEQVLGLFLLVCGMYLAMQAEAVPLVEELKLVEDSGAEMYACLPLSCVLCIHELQLGISEFLVLVSSGASSRNLCSFVTSVQIPQRSPLEEVLG